MSVLIRIAMQMMTIQIPSDISMQISVRCQKSALSLIDARRERRERERNRGEYLHKNA